MPDLPVNVVPFEAGSNETWPPRLALEPEPVLHLFTGQNFYSSADAAIREVILNAIDAVNRRSDASRQDVEPTIEVIFDTQNSTLSVSDNGDGMSQSDLINLFSMVGASAASLMRDANKRS